jgi:hypothetical protein
MKCWQEAGTLLFASRLYLLWLWLSFSFFPSPIYLCFQLPLLIFNLSFLSSSPQLSWLTTLHLLESTFGHDAWKCCSCSHQYEEKEAQGIWGVGIGSRAPRVTDTPEREGPPCISGKHTGPDLRIILEESPSPFLAAQKPCFHILIIVAREGRFACTALLHMVQPPRAAATT